MIDTAIRATAWGGKAAEIADAVATHITGLDSSIGKNENELIGKPLSIMFMYVGETWPKPPPAGFGSSPVRMIQYAVKCWGRTPVETETIWTRMGEYVWAQPGGTVRGLGELGSLFKGSKSDELKGIIEIAAEVTFDDNGPNIPPEHAEADISARNAESFPEEPAVPPLHVEVP